MKIPKQLTAALLTAAVALTAVVPAVAAENEAPPNANARAAANAVGSFELTQDFVQRSEAMNLDVARNPCGYGDPFGNLKIVGELGKGQISVDQAVDQFDAQPGMKALLAKHGLSAHDALIGSIALMAAHAGAMKDHSAKEGGVAGEQGVEVSSSLDTPTSRANVKFVNAHWSELQDDAAKRRAATMDMMKASGGKLPACIQKAMEQSMHGLHESGGQQ